MWMYPRIFVKVSVSVCMYGCGPIKQTPFSNTHTIGNMTTHTFIHTHTHTQSTDGNCNTHTPPPLCWYQVLLLFQTDFDNFHFGCTFSFNSGVGDMRHHISRLVGVISRLFRLNHGLKWVKIYAQGTSVHGAGKCKRGREERKSNWKL